MWTLGDRLRKARDAAGLNQDQLADELGISRRSITNYERGQATPIRSILIVWAMRCGVPFEWLADGTHPGGGGEEQVEPISRCTRPLLAPVFDLTAAA